MPLIELQFDFFRGVLVVKMFTFVLWKSPFSSLVTSFFCKNGLGPKCLNSGLESQACSGYPAYLKRRKSSSLSSVEDETRMTAFFRASEPAFLKITKKKLLCCRARGLCLRQRLVSRFREFCIVISGQGRPSTRFWPFSADCLGGCSFFFPFIIRIF
jgi:hypothetical protein